MFYVLSILVLALLFLLIALVIKSQQKLYTTLLKLHQNWEKHGHQLAPLHNDLENLHLKMKELEHREENRHTRLQQLSNLYLQIRRQIAEIHIALTESNKVMPQQIQSMAASIDQKLQCLTQELSLQEAASNQAMSQKIGSLVQYYDQLQEVVRREVSINSTQLAPLLEHIAQHIEQLHAQYQHLQDMITLLPQQGNLLFQQTLQEILKLQKDRDSFSQTITQLIADLQPLLQESHSWAIEPLAHRKDLEKKKVAVFADFENFFISLWDKDLEIFDYDLFKNSLIDPEGQNLGICDRIVFFTNKSRWQRKEFYDKKKNISQKEATLIKENLKSHGCRIIESDSNIDVPLSLLAITTGQKGEVEEFVLVANDGTYAGLLKELSNLGCIVSGILLGEASGDLIACYKKLGYKRYHLKTIEDLARFGIRCKYGNSTDPAEIRPSYESVTTQIATLLSLIRKQRMQFLGHPLQDQVLRAIHEQLMLFAKLTRQELLENLQKKLQNFLSRGSLTKTKINNILNILWKSPSLEIEKHVEEASTLIRLNSDYREYDRFRSAHDQVLLQIASEADLNLSLAEWSQFLYNSSTPPPELEENLQKFQTIGGFNSVDTPAYIPLDGTSSEANIPDNKDSHSLEEPFPEFDSSMNLSVISGISEELSKQILACIRKHKMQFLGSGLQDQMLRIIHEFLREHAPILRSNLLEALYHHLFQWVQTNELSKTKIAGLVAIFRKSHTLQTTKDNEVAYVILAQPYQNYSEFRKAHDGVFVRAALEEGLSMQPYEWSQLLYGNPEHAQYFAEIILQQKSLLSEHQEEPGSDN